MKKKEEKKKEYFNNAGISWHNTDLSWQNGDKSKTQQPVLDRKQLHRCRKWGNGSWSWYTIHNLLVTRVVWTKGHMLKKVWLSFRTAELCSPGLCLLTSFLLWLHCPLQSFFLPREWHCLVSPLMCVDMCRELFWWNQSQKQLAS